MDPAEITLGDIYKALRSLTEQGASVESIRWVLDTQIDPGDD